MRKREDAVLAAPVQGAQATSRFGVSSRVWAVIPLVVLQLALWIGLLAGAGLFREGPNGRNLGVDFAVFVSGAQVLKDGGNPYDNRVLYRTEQRLLNRQGLAAPPNARLVRLANPPLLYWALEPLASRPFRTTAWLWIGTMLAVTTLGFVATLRYVGWNLWMLPTIVFLLMPQVLIGIAYGNVNGLIFGAMAASLLLLDRWPVAAGLVLSLTWLKPQVAFPLALLIVLFQTRQRISVLAGAALGTVALLALTFITAGERALADWIGGIAAFSGDVRLQPNIASLAGLYSGWASNELRVTLELLSLGLACAATAYIWRHGRSTGVPSVSVTVLWILWFLATPYAHFPDEVLLTLPVLVLLGRDGRQIPNPAALAALYVLFFSVILFPAAWPGVNLLCLTLVAVAACFVIEARRQHRVTQEAI